MSSFLPEHKNYVDIATYLAIRLRKTDSNKRKCQCADRLLRTNVLPTGIHLVYNSVWLMCTFTHSKQVNKYPNKDHSDLENDCDRYSG